MGFPKPIRTVLIAAGSLFLLLAVFFAFPFPSRYLESGFFTERVLDRKGRLLAEFNSYNGGFCKPVRLAEIPPEYLGLLLFSEDRNFYRHPGFSIRSTGRALLQNLFSGKTVSGGSTITQQLARIKLGIVKSSVWTKPAEIMLALKLSLHFGKRAILESYINQVYQGNMVYGFGKAAETYFGKSPDRLDPLEFSALVCQIPSPEKGNLYRDPVGVERKAKALLSAAATNREYGIGMSGDELKTALEESLDVQRTEPSFLAPHFCFYVRDEARRRWPRKKAVSIRTTLDLDLYDRVKDIAANQLRQLERFGAKHAGAIILDNRTMELVVMLGSVDYRDPKGQINAALIRRPPASTMKPFNYALALERNIFNPASILPDVYSEFPSPVGKYIPRNYDGRYHGPVRLAVALGSSYNVPAVYTLNRAGLFPFYLFLNNAGFSLDRPASFYGLGLTLGSAECSLLELATAYAMFPNGGNFSPSECLKEAVFSDGTTNSPLPVKPSRLISPETAFLISHILSDYRYKVPAFGNQSSIRFPFPVAVKTGTSRDFEDNVVCGYTPLYTVAVWVGNLDNRPMRDLPAVLGAGSILRDIILELYNRGEAFPEFSAEGLRVHQEKICALSGLSAGPECPDTIDEYFRDGEGPGKTCDWHVGGRIVFPDAYREWAESRYPSGSLKIAGENGVRIVRPGNGDVFQLDTARPLSNQRIPLEAESASGNVRWRVDSIPVGTGREILWLPLPGRHVISAEDPSGGLRNEIAIIVTSD